MMTFQGLINYWTDPSMHKHGGSGGSVTFTTNQWWTVNKVTPGRYYIGVTSSGLSAFVIHKTNPIAQIGNANSQLSNPKQLAFATLPEGNTSIAIQPMVNRDSTGTVSQLIVIDGNKIDGLKSIIGEDFPYFDYKTMPLNPVSKLSKRN